MGLLYVMEHRALSFWIILGWLSVASCIFQSEFFILNSDATNKTCPLPDQMFTLTTAGKIACVNACLQWSGCKGVSYTSEYGLCTGCSGHYDLFSVMIDAEGSLFYANAAGIVGCGGPVVFDEHVVLGTFGGYSSIGTQVTYTCTPCTYFPLVENPVITCLANLTWTTPKCVYGPDVGRLANNDTIPSGEIGCAEFYGNTCEGSGMAGDLLRYTGVRGDCFCDTECCYSEDCCFDSTCNDVTQPIG